MIKEIIFFDDINLYNRCGVEAERNNMIKTTDYVVFCLENYFKKKDDKFCIKKPIELWLACEKEARAFQVTIADFVEAVCRQSLDGNAPQENTNPEITERKLSIWRKISDFMVLPKG